MNTTHYTCNPSRLVAGRWTPTTGAGLPRPHEVLAPPLVTVAAPGGPATGEPGRARRV